MMGTARRSRRTAAAMATAAVVLLVAPGTALGDIAPPPEDGGAPASADPGTLGAITRTIGARDLWAGGHTGRGVDVAVIDTGVTRVPGLDDGNVVDGPDLSADAADPARAHRDGFGHGTHIASIVAGRDAAPGGFTGVAPGSRVVNIKVGAADGSVDVSQVIAAITWVAEHGRENGLNIRVLNLSYGTDSTQDHRVDPLAYAAEIAWRRGVVVVAAAGNDGVRELADPARSPHVLAVGAADPAGGAAPYSNHGTGGRGPDVLAPGHRVQALRAPGSVLDLSRPRRDGGRFIRGTGTSQAAAVTSGAAALLIGAHPALTPDEVKGALMRTAGDGVIDVGTAHAALSRTTPALLAAPPAAAGTGTGSLEAARGSYRPVTADGRFLGETDIFGRPWAGRVWAHRARAGTTWMPDPRSTDASRNALAEPAWAGRTWVGGTWTGRTWVGRTWVGRTWVGRTWVGRTWVGRTWVGRTWVGRTWVGRTWVGNAWASEDWQ